MSDTLDTAITPSPPHSTHLVADQLIDGTSSQMGHLDALNQALDQLPDALRPWDWQLAQRNVEYKIGARGREHYF